MSGNGGNGLGFEKINQATPSLILSEQAKTAEEIGNETETIKALVLSILDGFGEKEKRIFAKGLIEQIASESGLIVALRERKEPKNNVNQKNDQKSLGTLLYILFRASSNIETGEINKQDFFDRFTCLYNEKAVNLPIYKSLHGISLSTLARSLDFQYEKRGELNRVAVYKELLYHAVKKQFGDDAEIMAGIEEIILSKNIDDVVADDVKQEDSGAQEGIVENNLNTGLKNEEDVKEGLTDNAEKQFVERSVQIADKMDKSRLPKELSIEFWKLFREAIKIIDNKKQISSMDIIRKFDELYKSAMFDPILFADTYGISVRKLADLSLFITDGRDVNDCAGEVMIHLMKVMCSGSQKIISEIGEIALKYEKVFAKKGDIDVENLELEVGEQDGAIIDGVSDTMSRLEAALDRKDKDIDEGTEEIDDGEQAESEVEGIGEQDELDDKDEFAEEDTNIGDIQMFESETIRDLPKLSVLVSTLYQDAIYKYKDQKRLRKGDVIEIFETLYRQEPFRHDVFEKRTGVSLIDLANAIGLDYKDEKNLLNPKIYRRLMLYIVKVVFQSDKKIMDGIKKITETYTFNHNKDEISVDKFTRENNLKRLKSVNVVFGTLFSSFAIGNEIILAKFKELYSKTKVDISTFYSSYKINFGEIANAVGIESNQRLLSEMKIEWYRKVIYKLIEIKFGNNSEFMKEVDKIVKEFGGPIISDEAVKLPNEAKAAKKAEREMTPWEEKRERLIAEGIRVGKNGT